MPDLEQAIYTKLSATAGITQYVGMRIRPNGAEQADDWRVAPYLVYTTISEAPVDHLTGYCNLTSAVVQFDAFAASYLDAKAIAKALKAALRDLRNVTVTGAGITTDLRDVHIVGQRDLSEPAGDGSSQYVYRTSTDVSINYREN